MSNGDLLTGLTTLLLLALFVVAAIPQLSRNLANLVWAHSEAMSVFWAWQAAAFKAYAMEFQKARR
jgi:hypothetical protein